MTPHEKAIKIIELSKYNDRQVGEILKCSTKGAELKRKKSGSNQFLENDLEKLKSHFETIITALQ